MSDPFWAHVQPRCWKSKFQPSSHSTVAQVMHTFIFASGVSLILSGGVWDTGELMWQALITFAASIFSFVKVIHKLWNDMLYDITTCWGFNTRANKIAIHILDKVTNNRHIHHRPKAVWQGLKLKIMSGHKITISYENLVATLKMLVAKLIEAI